jgi:hypothetical protein
VQTAVSLGGDEGSRLMHLDPTKKEQPMPDEKEKTIERGKEPDPQPMEPEEELSELDLEEVAGASCAFTKMGRAEGQ